MTRSTSAAIAATESSSATLTVMGWVVPAPSSAALAAAPSPLRSAMYTKHPWSTRPLAISAPKPWAPPVTRATRPVMARSPEAVARTW